MRRLCSSLLLSLLIASSATAVTIAWTPIGDPGNACQVNSNGLGGQGCYGGVSYSYSIGTYSVTNAQYLEFLNAKAPSDPLGLYNPLMASQYGGITRSGSSGSYTYSVISGRENWPVAFASFFDALRFANWMNNGEGGGDTETGAYTLLGGTARPDNGGTVVRNPGAVIVLPTDDEWYKAAFYDSSTSSYFRYPTGSNTVPTCSGLPTAVPNTANCGNPFGNLVPVGSYPNSPSPYGTFDNGANIGEFNETIIQAGRVFRGSSWQSQPQFLGSEYRGAGDMESEHPTGGFRLAMIPGGYVPEPGTGVLVIAGLLGIAGGRRRNP